MIAQPALSRDFQSWFANQGVDFTKPQLNRAPEASIFKMALEELHWPKDASPLDIQALSLGPHLHFGYGIATVFQSQRWIDLFQTYNHAFRAWLLLHPNRPLLANLARTAPTITRRGEEMTLTGEAYSVLGSVSDIVFMKCPHNGGPTQWVWIATEHLLKSPHCRIQATDNEGSRMTFSDFPIVENHCLALDDAITKALMERQFHNELFFAGIHLSFAQFALQGCLNEARSRVTFGQPLIRHQHIEFKIAELQARVDAFRAFLECAETQTPSQILVESMQRLASDLLPDLADNYLQISGGRGYCMSHLAQTCFHEVLVNGLA